MDLLKFFRDLSRLLHWFLKICTWICCFVFLAFCQRKSSWSICKISKLWKKRVLIKSKHSIPLVRYASGNVLYECGCFFWKRLFSKYISCWNFLLYFVWQSETRKICPLDLHFVENLNGKSPVRASPSPLWVWYEIPENSFRNAKDSKRSRRWRVLCSEAPLSTKGLSLSLIPSSCKPELIVHGIGSIFYCSLKNNFWLSFLQQVICFNWKILQLSARIEKA